MILTLAAEGIFLAPNMQTSVFDSIPPWLVNASGILLYVLGMLMLACVLLNYNRPAQTWVFLSTAASMGVVAFVSFQKALFIESALLGGLALAFLLSNWVPFNRDWLTEATQWINLLLGAGLLLRPTLFLSAVEYHFLQPETVRYAFAGLMLASAAASFLLSRRPSPDNLQAIILALPWVLWGLMLIIPFYLFNVIIASSLSAGLILKDVIPWEKLAPHQNRSIRRRFIRLIFAFQSLSLALVFWLIQLAANSPALPLLTVMHIHEIALAGYVTLTLISITGIACLNLWINEGLSDRSDRQPPGQEYEKLLARQISLERRRMAQLNLLHQLNLELESILDPPVSAQLTANAVFSALGGTLTSIFQYDPEHDELVMLAASGPLSGTLPPGYRQPTTDGLIGRAGRLRHTQLASDTRLDPNYFKLENQDTLSEIAIPMLSNNRLRGVIAVDQPEANAFDDGDIHTLETVAVQLVTSWERSEHDQRLTSLIGAGVTLSTTLDVEGVIKEIAETARQTLDALFVFVALADKGGGYTRTAHVGYAPTLLSILNSDPAGNTLIQTALNSDSSFRLRDVRKRFSSTPTGSNDLRSLLATPVRIRQSSIGAILAFGKRGNLAFSESDESLASLLATQAAAAIETTWLYQELRSLFTTATQLQQLSTRVIQSEQLANAAASIAETAYRISKGQAAGIVLLSLENEIETKVQIDADGIHPGAHHPMNLVKQAMESGHSIIISGPKDSTRVCLPLQTPRRQYGALWVEVTEEHWSNARFSDNLHTLANQAAIALERSILLVETRKQADEIEDAYRELEQTYDQTLAALSSALDARDRETEGHSLRVARIGYGLARQLGLSVEQAKTLERGAILHDIGKIGIADSILLKPGPLDPQEWQMMRQHPDIGARIIEGVPFLQEALPVIRYHQERWDGSGYPIGLKGADIPLLARIFAVVDAFDALTTERPYRAPISVEEAMEFINSKSGVLFDPAIVAAFGKMVGEGLVAELI